MVRKQSRVLSVVRGVVVGNGVLSMGFVRFSGKDASYVKKVSFSLGNRIYLILL
jgi:hypothetical protein